MRSRRKRPYLLLEILLAFALVAACLVPLTSYTFFFQRYQLKTLDKIAAAHLDRVRFAEIRSRLYQNEIPLNTLLQYTSTPTAFDNPYKTETLDFPFPMKRQSHEEKGRQFLEKLCFVNKGSGVNKEGERVFLIFVNLYYSPIKKPKEKYKFEHKVFIKEKASIHPA